MNYSLAGTLRSVIRQVPDFPKPGINFYDITSVTHNAIVFREVVDALHDRYADAGIDAVAGIDARGFIFGAALAHRLRLGFIPVRKAGKLPPEVEQLRYGLEYGEGTLEMQRHAISKGSRILLVDDLLATGGTARASCDLISKLGGEVAECAFVVELTFLNGRDKLFPVPTFSLVQFDK